MKAAPTQQEKIEAIRAVRLAAHELSNVCAAIVGGTEMAVSLPTVDTIGDDTHGFMTRILKGLRPNGGE
ncbi:hypothetical protein EGM87_22850 [Sphingobium sp. RSMS]|uniref:hypothetical protein n=1 Tax=Sphingobium sp. RSMS TaxID=520734 RepID=UPI0010F78CAF|nr:hypothetical protein [Sphingobium sp. RSMS]UXC93138.1 hypothetical protein EGM87_22850 [Sphingobium sp. RSMS]